MERMLGPLLLLAQAEIGVEWQSRGDELPQMLAVRAGLDDGVAGQHCLPHVRHGSPTSPRPTSAAPSTGEDLQQNVALHALRYSTPCRILNNFFSNDRGKFN